MTNIAGVRELWSGYGWPEHGDEWSRAWGGTPYLWHGVILPRILAMIPADGGLEIAPGHGRFTLYLKDLCRDLRLVDVTEECIAACRQRFASATHLSYHVNDGSSLGFVPPRSVDFVFSFDSLVHAEEEILEAYLAQLADILRPDAFGFIHHSNLAALSGLRERGFRNHGGRAESMSADRFRDQCASHGLCCTSQEIVNWGATDELTDCFSAFTPAGSRHARPLRRVENPRFMAQAAALRAVAALYGAEATGGGAS